MPIRRETKDQLRAASRKLDELNKAVLNILEDFNAEKTELEKAKAKDEAILASIGDGLFAVDKKGNIIMMNAQAEAILAVHKRDVMGKRYDKVWSLEDRQGKPIALDKRPVDSALATGKKIMTTASTGYLYLRHDKKRFPVAETVTPIRLKGAIVGAVTVFRDVSHEEEVDRAKSEFISLAAHQLRTPPAAISWYIEMLLAGDAGKLNEKQRDFFDEICNNNKRTIDIVEALLNVSRIELGVFSIEPKPTNIISLVGGIVGDELKPQIVAKGLRIKESYDEKIALINADSELLRIVLQNIISNAVKYVFDKGTVTIRLQHVKRGERKGGRVIREEGYCIVVSDTGCGIPENQQSKIFTKLFRADNARARKPDGSGLGLYITKSILDHSGGTIWFVSKENKGTSFFVTFPIKGMKEKKGEKKLH